VSSHFTPKRVHPVRGSLILIAYLIPPKNTETTQGECAFFDIDVKGGEKDRSGCLCCHQCQRGRLLACFYRQFMLVIDGKYINDDGLSTGRMCQAGTRSLLGRRCRESSTRSEYAAMDLIEYFPMNVRSEPEV
jgi:hypothetical protein